MSTINFTEKKSENKERSFREDKANKAGVTTLTHTVSKSLSIKIIIKTEKNSMHTRAFSFSKIGLIYHEKNNTHKSNKSKLSLDTFCFIVELGYCYFNFEKVDINRLPQV